MALAMVLDYAGVSPDQARNNVQVKLPRESRRRSRRRPPNTFSPSTWCRPATG
jgi:hypothetical protein